MPNDHEHAGCGEVDPMPLADRLVAWSKYSYHEMHQPKARALFGEAAERITTLTAEVERQKAIVARVQTAARGIMHAEGQELAMLREKSRGEWVASQTLESEREANALLTAELERVRAETIEAAAKVAERDAAWTTFAGRGLEQWEDGADGARDYRLGIRVGGIIAAHIRSLAEASHE